MHDVIGHLADAGDAQIIAMSAEPVGTPPEFIVTDGRLPAGSTDVLLGLRAAESLGAAIGDTVTLAGDAAQAELVVVGLGVIDAVDVRSRLAGAIVTRTAFQAMFGDAFMFRYGDVGLEPGADLDKVIPEMYAALATVPGADPDNIGILPQGFSADDIPPGLRFLRPLPAFLAGFVALLALGAIGHALTAAVRRRGYDIAVLGALGMVRSQSRRVVATQAAVLAVVGLAVGIPLGVAMGRVVWQQVAGTLFIHYVPPMAASGLALVVPGAFAALILLAAWPARQASSLRTVDLLRAE